MAIIDYHWQALWTTMKDYEELWMTMKDFEGVWRTLKDYEGLSSTYWLVAYGLTHRLTGVFNR